MEADVNSHLPSNIDHHPCTFPTIKPRASTAVSRIKDSTIQAIEVKNQRRNTHDGTMCKSPNSPARSPLCTSNVFLALPQSFSESSPKSPRGELDEWGTSRVYSSNSLLATSVQAGKGETTLCTDIEKLASRSRRTA
ncbi:hypothetical protein KM043_011077 [Ampulex compressa]|nr:hypothetical protein KM043_011077 [Ampulex compressa]